jgi:hypothetical protein
LRLLALVPLSGHALFASSLAVHELLAPRAARTPFALALAVLGLATTAWYKLGVWGDPGWFAASLGLGAAIGWVAASEKLSRRAGQRRHHRTP